MGQRLVKQSEPPGGMRITHVEYMSSCFAPSLASAWLFRARSWPASLSRNAASFGAWLAPPLRQPFYCLAKNKPGSVVAANPA